METTGIIWTSLTLCGLAFVVAAHSGRMMLGGIAMLCIAWAMWAFIPFH